MFHKDRDKYYDLSKQLYTHGIMDYNNITNIRDNYINFKGNKTKEKDYYEL